jgi:putative ABC transport system permease protein
MIINYVKIAIRLLLRNPFFSIINVVGLAVGFASFFGLWNYAMTELRSDQYHKDHERIVRLAIDWNWTDDHVNWGHMIIQASPSPTIPRLRNECAEIVDFVRIRPREGILCPPVRPNDVYKEVKIIEADSNLFSFFSIPLIFGQAADVLAEGNSIVLSKNMAQKYFGDQDPRNEMLVLNGNQTLKVTGVFQNLPHNTHLDFDFVLSNQTKMNSWNQDFKDWTLNYVKLSNSDFGAFEQKVNSRIPFYWAELFEYFNSVKASVKLQPLGDVAFQRDHDDEGYRMKSRASLKTMAWVGITILVMAWLNYINLTIARTARRMKEVATRKISGAGSRDFMRQFMMEALVTNFLAAILALTFLQLLRQPAATLLNVVISDWHNIDTSMALFFLLIFSAGIIITGAYPAIVSRAAAPVELFQQAKRKSKGFLLSTFTTMQYTLAIVLLFCAIVMHHQMNFILNFDMGVDTKNVFMIEPALIRSQNHAQELNNLKLQLSAEPEIVDVIHTSYFKNLMMRRHAGSELLGIDGTITLEGHVPFFKNKLLAGRNFIQDDRDDIIIVSRLTTQRLGFSSVTEAIGQKILVGDSVHQMEIVGVIEDFRTISFLKMGNTEGPTGRGQGLVYKKLDGMYADALAIRLEEKSITALAKVEVIYKKIFPQLPLVGVFLDDWNERKYAGEKILHSQITFFTGLAIAIACLGLAGIISNTIIDKTREIGIRKALGAGWTHLVSVLLNASVFQVAIATLIALSAGYFLSDAYLERYLQRISLNPYHYLIPVVTLVVIMGSAISMLIVRAITTNPVESLRHE